MNKRLHVYYSGRVQGVGFRFTADRVARAMDVCGWVKNLSDGRVEIVAESSSEILQNFLRQIETEMRHDIREKSIEYTDANDEFVNFRIRF